LPDKRILRKGSDKQQKTKEMTLKDLDVINSKVKRRLKLPSQSEAKQFLQMAADLLSTEQQESLGELPTDFNFTLEQVIEEIQTNLSKIRQSDNDVLNHYVNLSKTLKLLKKNWLQSPSTSFYNFCDSTFDLKKSTICSIIQFGTFINQYPKFRQTGINYTIFKNILSKLTAWFCTTDANSLSADDVLSPKFWK